MKLQAHIIKVTILGTVNFKVTPIDPQTGKYYTSCSEVFRTKKEAVHYIEVNGMSIKNR